MAEQAGGSDLEAAYKAHAGTVYRFLLAQCGSAQLAEELTQETFYQAVRSIDRYDGSCKLSVWLCQIAKHLWYQQLRRKRRETPLGDLPPEEEGGTRPVLPCSPSPEEAVQARQRHLQLLHSIHVLPEAAREVVYLRALGELSFAEIGEIMGKTENWARVTFYRSKEKLRRQEQERGSEK